jgi:hypothetical protein
MGEGGVKIMKEGGVKIMKEGKDKIIFNFCKMNPIDY